MGLSKKTKTMREEGSEIAIEDLHFGRRFGSEVSRPVVTSVWVLKCFVATPFLRSKMMHMMYDVGTMDGDWITRNVCWTR